MHARLVQRLFPGSLSAAARSIFAASRRTFASSSPATFAPRARVSLARRLGSPSSRFAQVAPAVSSSLPLPLNGSRRSLFAFAGDAPAAPSPSTHTASSATMAATSERDVLPDDVRPVNYALTLEPNLDTFRFAGDLDLEGVVEVATDRISLDAQDLLFHSASFVSGGRTIAAVGWDVCLQKRRVTFRFKEQLPTGPGALKVKFDGTLNNEMAGFYRSSYKDLDGKPRVMATTQFEAVDARRAFPCVDEPGVKATFDITMKYKVPVDGRQLTCLSNMPEQRRHEVVVDGERKQVVSFMRTPTMSTYLLAFVLGELEHVQTETKDGTLVRCLCVPGRTDQLQFALKCGVAALEFYNEFFGLPYPLPKLDMVAIPDFQAGAMENWGLVTYREIDLLCDDKTISVARKIRLATIVTHELAHQWFGNLVTMAWWDDLWLNEGFACFMESYCLDRMVFAGETAPAGAPFKLWERFASDQQAYAMRADALRSSHPIQVPIPAGELVDEVFDGISYMKGACAVQMVEAILGEEHFREGLRAYMKRHAYSNTVTSDLWACWAETSGKPVADIMDGWVKQMGYPVLNVEAQGAGKLLLRQQWFLSDGSSQAGDDKPEWRIPLFVGFQGTNGNVVVEQHLVEGKDAVVQIRDAAAFEESPWKKLNYNQKVPLRVEYPADMMSGLAANYSALPAQDRIGLINDAVALYRTGQYLQDGSVFRLLGACANEEAAAVWTALKQALIFFSHAFQNLDPALQNRYDAWVERTLVQPLLTRTGGLVARPGESDLDRKMRADAVGLATSLCPHVIVDTARHLFTEYHNSLEESVLPDDVKASVFSTVLGADETAASYDRLMSVLARTESQACRLAVYRAAGSAKGEAERLRALEMSLDSDVTRMQDFMYPLTGQSGVGAEEQKRAWFESQFLRVVARVAKGNPMLMMDAVALCMGGWNEGHASRLESFQKKHAEHLTLCGRTISQTLEKARGQERFVNAVKASAVAKSGFQFGA